MQQPCAAKITGTADHCTETSHIRSVFEL